MTAENAIPETKYAECDGLSIAYQVFGSGAQDLVMVPGIVSHLELSWSDPDYARMCRALARSFRVITFDKRGQGMSDAFDGVPTLEQRMDDVRAVMAAAGSRRAILLGFSEGGAILPQIRRPTLVLHRRGDRVSTKENGRYLADHVPEAIYLELPGEDHPGWVGDQEAFIDAIVHFAKAPVPVQEVAADRYLATVLFTDIVGSTEQAARLGDRAWRDLLQKIHAIWRHQLEALRGREIDTAGDGLFATFDGPARAVNCAAAIGAEAKKIGIELRAGLHTGEVETTGEKVSGLAVHIGARVMALAGAGEILVSSTVKDLVAGSGIAFEDRGAHALKGVPGEWRLSRALVNA